MSTISGVQPPVEPSWARSNWQSYCVRLRDNVDQRELMQSLLDRDVATKRGIMCAHRQPAYAIEPWSCRPDLDRCVEREVCGRLAESARAEDHSILLPLYPAMTTAEQDQVVAAVDESIETAAASTRTL